MSEGGGARIFTASEGLSLRSKSTLDRAKDLGKANKRVLRV